MRTTVEILESCHTMISLSLRSLRSDHLDGFVYRIMPDSESHHSDIMMKNLQNVISRLTWPKTCFRRFESQVMPFELCQGLLQQQQGILNIDER